MTILPAASVSSRTSAFPWRGVFSEIIRLIKYGLVGASNVAVSLVTLNLFFLFFHPNSPQVLVIASSLAYLAGDLNSYWWNRGFTFGLPKPTWGSFFRFGAVTIAAMVLNAGVVWTASGALLNSVLPNWLAGNLSQVSATLWGTLGYVACRCWVFRGTV